MDRQKLEKANKLIKEIDELNNVKDFVGEGRPPRNINDEIPCISKITLFLNHNESLEFCPDDDLNDKIMFIIRGHLKEKIEKLNKEFEEL